MLSHGARQAQEHYANHGPKALDDLVRQRDAVEKNLRRHVTQPRVTQYAKGRTQQTLLDMGGHHDSATVQSHFHFAHRLANRQLLREEVALGQHFRSLEEVDTVRLTLSDGSSLGGATRGG